MLVGANILGRLHMELRDLIAQPGGVGSRVAAPEDVPNYRILGRLVEDVIAPDLPAKATSAWQSQLDL